ncbi:hypothetical protein Pla110_43540 [Polystyrenella longa]|uniref:Uncharacterized protein n=1 Tax=Polystyrenella longa TaxID=2528007 RepID=A0A518CTU1_9PLAN|nr:hypothetical protein [Polystyrenella longa]QDU82594.1 hypothetical protein Pla110_43540 [Polystyrenella longa]
MTIWQKIETPSDRSEYFTLLKSSSEAYADAQLDGLNRLLDERNGQAYLYQETGPPGFFLLLLITPSPSPSREGVWKLVHFLPGGEFDPEEALRILARQTRKVLDEMGITRYYGRPLKHYNNPQTVEFYKQARERLWELTEVEDRPGHIAYTYHLHRDPTRHNEDELFQRQSPAEQQS